jgi:hypothetical protein
MIGGDEIAAMSLQNATGDGKTQSCPAGAAIAGTFCPVERSKEMR